MPERPFRPSDRREPGFDRGPARAGAMAETWSQRLRRRARDLLVMGVVGPACGLLALAGLQSARWAGPAAPAKNAVVARTTLPPVIVPAVPSIAPEPPPPPSRAAADFGSVQPTPDARRMADWIVSRADNGKLPFFVIDKIDARLYVFDASGALLGDAPVLLGAARGDDSFPGIGNVPIAQVRPYQRTTPAGRFVTQPGLDDEHHDVVWVDYDAAVAMHRVINKVRTEHRPERLASPSPRDNRISFGCINVPIAFFDSTISPIFGRRRGVAYIIPEVRSFKEVFEEHVQDSMPVATGAAPAGPQAVR